MLLVVIGHSFLGEFLKGPSWESVLCKFAYSFHMPLFMFVSGWLFYLTRLNTDIVRGGKSWPYSTIVKDKAQRLLLPGLAFSIVAFALKIAFPGEMSRQVGLSLQEIAHQYLYPNDNPLRELWFIATLFWYFVLTPIWRTMIKKEWTMWITMAILVVFHFKYPDSQLLCIDCLFRYAIWFYMGLVISKKEIVVCLLDKNPLLTLFAGVIIYIVGYLSNEFITTMGGIMLSFGLALFLDKYLPQTFFTFRNYTYQIFLIGIFAQILVKIVYRHMDLPYLLAYLLCIAVGIYVPVVASVTIRKINFRPLLLCIGLK